MIARLPRRVLLELTPECNFRCPFCYCVWHEFPELAAKVLDTAGWQKTIDEIARSGGREFTFTGGEPLLRKDLFEIIDRARKALPDGRFSVFTNGSRMTEELIREFKRRKVHLATSLQGLRTYGAMTGTRRTFRRQLALIAKAAELKWPFAVSVVATSSNIGELSDIVSAAALSGASNIQVGAVMAEGRCKKHLGLMLTRAQWKAAKAELGRLPGIRISFADEFICTCRRQPEGILSRFSPGETKACTAGRSFCAIGPDGTYRKCLHTVDRETLSGQGSATET